MTEEIAAALRAAAVPICKRTCPDDCECPMGPAVTALETASAAVAAFLRALPWAKAPGSPYASLASAVEEVANAR